MLPMSQGRCSLVWCHPQSRRDEVQSWSDERFCQGCSRRSAGGWGVYAGKRSVYPLALTTASRAVSHRTALVGNAAQTLHPIARQGFNLGLRDVMSWRNYSLTPISAAKMSVIIRCVFTPARDALASRTLGGFPVKVERAKC